MELGGEGEYGAATLLEMRGNVDDEGGTDGSIGGGVKDFERAVRFAVERKLLESGEEAALVAEGGGMVVVRVTGFPIRENDRFGAGFADYSGEPGLVLASRVDVGVRYAERAAPAHAKNLGGFAGFFGAGFWYAARAHFACGEVEDAGLITAVSHFQKRSAASEFNVVGVGGDGEQVKV